MALQCPSCKSTLAPTKMAIGLLWCCPTCGGRAATWGLLQRISEDKILKRLWAKTYGASEGTNMRPCPCCLKPMAKALFPANDTSVEIDICRRCQFAWFDVGEFSEFPISPSKIPFQLTYGNSVPQSSVYL